jgi:hypothetical protein
MTYATPPPPPGTPVPEVQAEPEPKIHLEVGLLAASPKGDWSPDNGELGAETSPGFGLQVGFAVAPNISIFGGLRYVKIELQEQPIDGEEFKLTHRELQLGVRFTTPVAPAAKLFIQGDVHRSTATASFQGDSESISGTGFGVRGGVIFMVDRKIGLGVGVGYSSADLSNGGDDSGDTFDDSWLTGDLSLGFLF